MVLRYGAGRVLPSPDHAGADRVRRQPWSVLVLLCVAQFMVVLDMTVVNMAGFASGLMTTAHEIGAGTGAAAFPAVAAATTGFATSGAGLAAGNRHATLAAAVVAAGLAVLAARAIPSVRPAAGAKVAVH